MTGLIALMLAGAATTTEVPFVRGASPLGNPGEWVGMQDYPPEALRRGDEGRVGFRLDISEEGAVSRCSITMSSGIPALDEATCRLITQRARFKPAQTQAGFPVPGTFSSAVRWTLPRDIPQPTEGAVETTFIVETDGRITDCRVVTAKGAPTEPGRLRSPCERQQRTQPFTDQAGRPVRKLVRARQVLTIENAP